jgi:uncharacterized protein (DUF1697 family)
VRQVILLRGVNLGPARRVGMADLRLLMEEAGFDEVSTYLQSGNVVLTSDRSPERLASEAERLIAGRFDLEVQVVVRTGAELAEVAQRNPLGEVAVDHKRYQVSFLSHEPEPELVEGLAALVAPQERFIAIGRELYAWHPRGVARSRLWNRLASRDLGITATTRNWATVTKLLAMTSS